MSHINWARVILGGIVAAVILFIAGFVIHGAILGADWMAWQQAGHLPLALPHGEAVVIWIILSLVNGLTGVWIYAASGRATAPARSRPCSPDSSSGSPAD
jgi:hypothetical protein